MLRPEGVIVAPARYFEATWSRSSDLRCYSEVHRAWKLIPSLRESFDLHVWLLVFDDDWQH